MTPPRALPLVRLLLLALLLPGCRPSQPEITPESPVLFEPRSIGVSSDGRHVTMPCRAWASGIGYQQYVSRAWDSRNGQRTANGMGQGTWSVWSPIGEEGARPLFFVARIP